jgi:glucose-1-phosphate cytidylyltransferase
VKVVLFCGGLGLRMREASDRIPKPMVPIGSRPILWHIMKYYAAQGHTEFILCLGYKAEVIKEYFLTYDETLSNDFVLHGDDHRVELMSRDIENWRISFVDTGLHTNIGQRLRMVRRYVGADEHFLATYGDSLTDAPLAEAIDELIERDKVASFAAVRPSHTFHIVSMGEDQLARGIYTVTDPSSDVWINGGFFIFRRDIFDHIGPGEDLVEEPFQRLIRERQLLARRYEGFWAAMDTLKDKQELDTLWESGDVPWRVWDRELA